MLSGVYTALVTPFEQDGGLDEWGLRQNIRFQIESGVDGIVPLGTTGESPTLDFEEQKRVVEIAIEEAKGKIPIVVGTGSYSTKKTIEATHWAEKCGADAALVVVPYYNKPTQEGLYLHFKAIVEAIPIPIIIYNIQGRTGQNLQTETLKRLVSLPNIAGVKESSGNFSQVSEVIEMVARNYPHFSVMSGDDANTLPIMALGGHGVISVVSNLFPKEVKALTLAIQNGNFQQAQEIHYALMPIIRGAFLETNPIPIKAAMHLCGMPAGKCRLPLCELQPENYKELSQILNTSNLKKHGYAQSTPCKT